MEQKNFNPFESQGEDLEIQNEEELNQAKEMAGVVGSQEHIERLLMSGDEKLMQAGLEKLKKQLQERDATIDSLKQQVSALENDKMQLDRVREALKIDESQGEMIIRDGNQERRIWTQGINEKIKEMSQASFENEFGQNLKSVGLDPRNILEGLKQPGTTWLNDPSEYLERVSNALKDETKDVIIVEGRTYIVEKN